MEECGNDKAIAISAWDVGTFLLWMIEGELADEEEQAGIQGQLQQESPAKKYLEQVKCFHDTDCNESMVKKRLHRLQEWDMGRVVGNLQEK